MIGADPSLAAFVMSHLLTLIMQFNKLKALEATVVSLVGLYFLSISYRDANLKVTP